MHFDQNWDGDGLDPPFPISDVLKQLFQTIYSLLVDRFSFMSSLGLIRQSQKDHYSIFQSNFSHANIGIVGIDSVEDTNVSGSYS